MCLLRKRQSPVHAIDPTPMAASVKPGERHGGGVRVKRTSARESAFPSLPSPFLRGLAAKRSTARPSTAPSPAASVGRRLLTLDVKARGLPRLRGTRSTPPQTTGVSVLRDPSEPSSASPEKQGYEQAPARVPRPPMPCVFKARGGRALRPSVLRATSARDSLLHNRPGFPSPALPPSTASSARSTRAHHRHAPRPPRCPQRLGTPSRAPEKRRRLIT